MLFGLPFTRASLPEIRDHLLRCLDEGRQQVVITPNTDHVVRVRRDLATREVYARADVVVPDGMPVVWAASLLGEPLPERVPGVDLMDAVAAALAGRCGSVYLLGGTRERVEEAARALVHRHPGIRLAGAHHGYFETDRPRGDADVLRAIAESRADALFVGMGSPRQEAWATSKAPTLTPRIVLCVGGALEVLAGHRRRAPAWMQRSGLEWTYRLAQEPGRLWKRYLVEDAAFIPVVLAEWRARRAA